MNRSHHQRGAAFLLFILFFLFGSVALTYLLSSAVYSDILAARTIYHSKVAYLTAEASLEDVAYRYLVGGFDRDATETLTLADASAETTTVSDLNAGIFTLTAIGTSQSYVRKAELQLEVGAGASFNFGVQTGNGGFVMTNSSKVIGNVFSNGNITGGGSSVIEGDVIAAGPGGTVDGVHATGSIRADIITDSTIDGDAFYGTTFMNNSYSGAVNGPGWPLEATSSLPFPDEQVDAHKATITAEIAAGTARHILATDPECLSGVFTINTSTSTGMIKIDCDVIVDKSSTVWTITDTVWIEGNLTFKAGPTIQATPAVSTTSVLVIVDNESNRSSSSQIIVQNGTNFLAPSSPKSYIMLLSMNDAAENGSGTSAISMGQSSNGDVIVYAGHGRISLNNQITLKEVTAYMIDMGNNTTIEYESGLINLNFTSGPGGGFSISSWQEIE